MLRSLPQTLALVFQKIMNDEGAHSLRRVTYFRVDVCAAIVRNKPARLFVAFFKLTVPLIDRLAVVVATGCTRALVNGNLPVVFATNLLPTAAVVLGRELRQSEC